MTRRLVRHRTSRMPPILALAGALALSAGLGAQAPASAGPPVSDSSYDAPDGTRVLRQSLVVPATVEQIWDALTTSRGLETWAVPFARADFRLGGVWESSYRRDATAGDPANIRNRFIAYQPLRMIAIQAIQAPPDFPHPELLPSLWTVIEIDPIETRRVRVTVSGVGYRSGPDHEAVYRLFERGNAWTLQQLHKRFTDGPIDWASALPSVK